MNDECAVFKADNEHAMFVQETFINIGNHYAVSDQVDISFDVFPDRLNHDGVLFSVGTEDYEYYEWKTKAVTTQFFVVEFYFSAISLLMKALNQDHMIPLEIFRTWPTTYHLSDARWHRVHVIRHNGTWHLYLDDIAQSMEVTPKNDVQLRDEPIFVGGKPGQYHYQFRGIIRNLDINGERVTLQGKAKMGLVEVWHCTAPEVRAFQDEIRAQQVPRRPGDYY